MYKIIDFKNTNLGTELGAELKGIYESIESNLNYAILLKNIVVEEKKYTDVYTTIYQVNDYYLIFAYNFMFKITNDNIITTSKILGEETQGTYTLKLQIDETGNKILKLIKDV